MAIAGDSHHIPSFKVSLGADNRVKVWTWATNKPRELVERDLDKALERLLAGERFELHCNGPQVIKLNEMLREYADEKAKGTDTGGSS